MAAALVCGRRLKKTTVERSLTVRSISISPEFKRRLGVRPSTVPVCSSRMHTPRADHGVFALGLILWCLAEELLTLYRGEEFDLSRSLTTVSRTSCKDGARRSTFTRCSLPKAKAGDVVDVTLGTSLSAARSGGWSREIRTRRKKSATASGT
ncbi:hypothetical protein B0H12DRAFT_1121451 [Mycena haematopus]|nr:hypothetical protein B0H12DRAFT_1121451 [Mycena haematopus]